MRIRDVYIRITKPSPPGVAPDEVRAAWVGLILPVNGPRLALEVVVLSSPKSRLGLLLACLRGKIKRSYGYRVKASTAVDFLEMHSPSAAQWWRENSPYLVQWGEFFFSSEASEEVQDLAALTDCHRKVQRKFDRERIFNERIGCIALALVCLWSFTPVIVARYRLESPVLDAMKWLIPRIGAEAFKNGILVGDVLIMFAGLMIAHRYRQRAVSKW